MLENSENFFKNFLKPKLISSNCLFFCPIKKEKYKKKQQIFTFEIIHFWHFGLKKQHFNSKLT